MLLISIMFFISSIFLNTYVLLYGWTNIVIPIFNAPVLSFYQMMALTFMLVAIKGIPIKINDKDDKNMSGSEGLLYISIASCIGSLITWFMLWIGTMII